MAQPQTLHDTITLSSLVEPPQLFDDEPTVIVFDRNTYISEPIIDISPFNGIVDIIQDENNYLTRLNKRNKIFVIVCIFPQWDYTQVRNFVQQNITIHPRIRLFCLFFIDGQMVNINAFGDNRLIGSHSVTSMITAETRHICSRANNLNITYCDNQRRINEQNGNISIADIYARQRDDRVRRELEYNRRILQEIQQRQQAQQNN